MKQREKLDHHSGRAPLLGNLLKDKRKAAGLSQSELATEIGLSRPYVSRLERGEYANPSPQALARIANRLNISLADLYAITGCTLPGDLPGYTAYLHAKHPGWAEEAIQDLTDYYQFIKQKYSVQ
jgi:transcriptional regulator with XRE-family HTH domain